MIHMQDLVKFINQLIERFSWVDRSAHRSRHPKPAHRVEAGDAHRISRRIVVALRMMVILTVLTGVVYPLAITMVAQAIFPDQANGSLILSAEQPVGSLLIGQAIEDARYFWPRPSAVNYMAGSTSAQLGASGATNYGLTSAALVAAVAERADAFRIANGLSAHAVVPPDMLFASGSGLDPHISPEAARLQIRRVAQARGAEPAVVAALVEQHIEAPQFGFLGAARVNVLRLNLALDRIQ
jgi:K+-transporting ATPase ATPase C chain